MISSDPMSASIGMGQVVAELLLPPTLEGLVQAWAAGPMVPGRGAGQWLDDVRVHGDASEAEEDQCMCSPAVWLPR
jgi:hypothetical protein